MANAHRGEIEGRLDGRPHRLVLTLGALCELEHAFGDADMLALTQRFEKGRLSARDCVKIIAAGLRGGGATLGDDDVAKMQADGGAAGYVDIVARLLNATFGAKAHDPFPDDVMAAGLGMLGLSPGAFWAMTPRELDAALRGRAGAFGAALDAPTNNDLAELMQRFPD